MIKKHVLLLTILFLSFSSMAQTINWDSLFKEAAKTEVYTPVPTRVTPGKTPQDPPSDAIILFNGKDLNAWEADDISKPISWKVADSILSVDNSKGYGGVNTKQKFMDYQLHLEWRIPINVTGTGQLCGNSGVNLAVFSIENKVFERGYEIQILESHKNSTYVNGQAAALYKQSIPLVNASKEPGEWQTYDIIWKAPRFNTDSSLKKPASVTLIHNGVLVQDNAEVEGQTLWIGKPFYKMHGASPIRLQSHGDPGQTVSFRNIWIRPL